MDSIKDLSTLTSLPYSSLTKVCKVLEDIICHAIIECARDFNSSVDIDIGIGILNIHHVDDTIEYHFTPSQTLEDKVIEAVVENKDFLVTSIEESLTNKIINSYKDLF